MEILLECERKAIGKKSVLRLENARLFIPKHSYTPNHDLTEIQVAARRCARTPRTRPRKFVARTQNRRECMPPSGRAGYFHA